LLLYITLPNIQFHIVLQVTKPVTTRVVETVTSILTVSTCNVYVCLSLGVVVVSTFHIADYCLHYITVDFIYNIIEMICNLLCCISQL